MDQTDILWIAIFSLLLTASNSIYLIIKSSLRDQPMGFQSIHDQALADNFLVGNLFGSCDNFKIHLVYICVGKL